MFKNNKWRIKGICFVITVLLLAPKVSAGETKTEESLLDGEYETIEASNSTYTENSVLKDVEWIFLKNDSLTLNGAQGTFGEYLISSGELVKQGDPILSYQAPYDKIAIEEMKLSLQRMESTYLRESKQKEELIEQQWKEFQRMDYDSIEAQLFALNIKKLEIQYTQYQNQSEKSLQELRTALSEQESKIELQYIDAPYDGIIVVNDKIKKDMELDPYEELAHIYDTKSALLGTQVNGPVKLWSGLEVSVTGISNMKEDKTNIHKGKVVAVDSVLNGKASTGYVYIKLEEEGLYNTIQRGNIKAQTVSVEGVLVIPTKVVKIEDDMSFVYILDQNNALRKQYITGRDNGTDMWVYSGLVEGQRIVVE